MVTNPNAVGATVASALNGTAIAVHKADVNTYKVFYQSSHSDVIEQVLYDGRGEKPMSIFKAKLRSPLAVVHGNERSEYGSGPSGPWSKVAQLPSALSGTGLAAIAWKDSGFQSGPTIRVYYQAQDSSLHEHSFRRNFSVTGMQYNTSIAASITARAYRSSAEGPHISVYGQDFEQNIVRFSQCAWEMHKEKLLGPLHPAASFSVP
ncbi:hypothetical protein HD806DRAFT_540964 [Xylariaceae sp. AK1471]|nr:hypothetical protein HD806DRAFT_540964 [Xylariaceae sp. AK1471]